MGLSTRNLAATVGFLTTACVLVIPAEEPGAHCGFRGAASECGRCIAERCALPIDACCRGDACGGVISDVEGCVAGDREKPDGKAACTRMLDAADRGNAHADLSTCIVKECTTACRFSEEVLPASRKNVTRCQRAYVTSKETCECEIGPKSNDVECTEVGHPNLRCCAADGWPAPDRACDCLRVVCTTAGAGCLCQLSAIDENDRSVECTGPICCYDPLSNNCSCGTVACRAQEKQVTTCTINELACDKGEHRVESCTVKKP